MPKKRPRDDAETPGLPFPLGTSGFNPTTGFFGAFFNAENMRHLYVRKLARLRRRGVLHDEMGDHHVIDIKHDDWCPALKDGYCTCDCFIFLDGKRVN